MTDQEPEQEYDRDFSMEAKQALLEQKKIESMMVNLVINKVLLERKPPLIPSGEVIKLNVANPGHPRIMSTEFAVEPLEVLVSNITNTEQEADACAYFAAAEERLRQIENERLQLTQPLTAAMKKWNATAKFAAAPLEETKAMIASALSLYRSSFAVREQLRLRERHEKEFRKAEKAGDEVALQAHSQSIAEINAVVPKSVPSSPTMVTRYRSSVELIIDESELPDGWWIRMPNEKAIKAALEEGQVIRGVGATTTLRPYCVAVGEAE